MKIALLQNNYTVSDLDGNARLIARCVREAARHGAELVVTSELSLTGYPPRDLLLESGFIRSASGALEKLARDLADAPPVLVGAPDTNDSNEGRPLYNTAALLKGGRVVERFRKTPLPACDVFDENRYFESAAESRLLDIGGRRIGITICEDLWNDADVGRMQRCHAHPLDDLLRLGADCLINMSASPFTLGKQEIRERMFSELARKHDVPLLYVNQVGGNDDLIFDGRSMAFDGKGKLFGRARPFDEDMLIVDLDSMTESVAEDDPTPEAEVWNALVLGTRDYVRKCGFKTALLGLSGGIDSALTAAIAADALGPENVTGVLMPSPYSSAGSVSDSLALAKNLGLKTIKLPIEKIMRVFDKTLFKAFKGYAPDVTEENIQARIRGSLLMALSNKHGAMLLATGNKSELAVGYCTMYGDTCGGLAVISDVPKTFVYRLARWKNRETGMEAVPEAIIAKPPSAELRPGQLDEDSLPSYDTLDAILALHVEEREPADAIAARGFDLEVVRRVIKMVKTAEFKRRQAAPGIKVTDRTFGTGWKMPVARGGDEPDTQEN